MKFAKKSLGQNFLVDLNILKKISNLTNLCGKDVIEIGPGKGALTDQILKFNPKSLILIEKDDVLCNELNLKYLKNNKIKIFNNDILKFNLEKISKQSTVILGNLPYNISSQILIKIIRFKKWPPKYLSIIFMFQKEMADRITGKYGTSNYGRLSILTDYRLSIDSKFNVSPNCFFPKPKVDSTVLHFIPKKKVLPKIKNIENLEKITNLFFSNRRKMINKNIKKIFKDYNEIDLIKDLNINLRPSELEPKKYFEITECFEKI
mgnify:CR=1 FL=1